MKASSTVFLLETLGFRVIYLAIVSIRMPIFLLPISPFLIPFRLKQAMWSKCPNRMILLSETLG